jgi:carbamoyl-phosphate synthase small subunit
MLEDGSSYPARGFGYRGEAAGEVVFNTGMVGYTEALTDPSYYGQILCMTYPLIGNYGVPSMEIRDEHGIPKYFESDKIQVKGLLVYELSSVASHWSCVRTLDEWLNQEKIPGIYGIDTRELTKKLRVGGVMMGAISVSERSIDEKKLSNMTKIERYDRQNLLPKVSITDPQEYGDINKECVVLLDTGVKYSIIRNIINLGYRVVCLRWDTPYEKIISYKPKGVVISNGPGDPRTCKVTIKTASKLISGSVPTLGICLGNQILALAAGAETYKLKFGHRGQNKPCINQQDNQAYITTQNHGYGIDRSSLDKTDFKVWFSNADDETVEGIEHRTKPIIAVQFHPEASPGPYDCIFVFNRFKELIEKNDTSIKLKSSNATSISRIKSKKEENCQRAKQ